MTDRCPEKYGDQQCRLSVFHQPTLHRTYVGVQLVKWRTDAELERLREAAAEASEFTEVNRWG